MAVADKSTIGSNTSDQEKLDILVSRTQRTLLKFHGVFPFDFFPDTIRIDENKVDITYRHFFFFKHMFPIFIKNINAARVNTGVFFASLAVEVTGFEINPKPVNYLWKRDAIKARRIILGLVVAYKEGVDVSQIPTHELVEKVEEIGKAQEHPEI